MTPEQLPALKTEIQSDPQAIGYAGQDHQRIAEMLNKPQRTVSRDTMKGGTLASCLDVTEFGAMTAGQRTWIQMLCSATGELTLIVSLKNDIQSVLAASPKSLARLIKSVTRSGSRAEELSFGNVTASDVADAVRE